MQLEINVEGVDAVVSRVLQPRNAHNDRQQVDRDTGTPQSREEAAAVIVGRTDEGDAAVAPGIAPASVWRIVHGGLVAGANANRLASACALVVAETDVALHAGQIELGNGATVEAPAGIAPRTEGIVDDKIDGDDATLTQFAQRGRPQAQHFVAEQDVGATGVEGSISCR